MSHNAQVTNDKDYHRYVFQNGRLVGQFERMYRESVEVPWRQHETVHAWWADVAIRVLELRAPYRKGIDIGCGVGYFTDRAAGLCRRMTGVDVSPTAVRKARSAFPHVTFRVLDIRKRFRRLPAFDLVIAKDLLWYTFPDLDQVIANLGSLTASDGRLFLFQSFPNLCRDFIGKGVIPHPERLVRYFLKEFVPEYSCECREEFRKQNGPMFMALLRKRG